MLKTIIWDKLFSFSISDLFLKYRKYFHYMFAIIKNDGEKGEIKARTGGKKLVSGAQMGSNRSEANNVCFLS